MILWLVALLALALPTPAATEEYARYDLALNRLMFRQAAIALEAGSLVEDWQGNVGGLTNRAALARLESLLKRSGQLARELDKLAPPAAGRTLHAAAVLAAKGRTDLIRQARDHVARGNPTPQSQREFMGKNLTATSELQARWLSDRLAAARSAPVHGPRLREYYAWQTQMLPLTRTQVRVGSDIQRLVFLSSASNVSLPDLEGEAGEATLVSFELRDKARAVVVPPWLKIAHLKARAEQAALSDLCAEIKAYTMDHQEEPVARVRRAFRDLRSASQQAEQASLEALAAALDSGPVNAR